jgi:hypothetical protein
MTAMKKKIRTFARLFNRLGAPAPQNGDHQDVEIGRGKDFPSLKNVHDHVRTNPDLYAYKTWQISVINDGTRDHTSAAFNESAVIKFGKVKRAEDTLIMMDPRGSDKTCLYTERYPQAKGKNVFVGGGRVEKISPEDHIYDRETGECLQPRPSLRLVK